MTNAVFDLIFRDGQIITETATYKQLYDCEFLNRYDSNLIS